MKKDDLKFKGKIVQSIFVPENPEAYLNHKQSFGDSAVSVTMKKWRESKNRSNQQSRYYWGVVIKLLAEDWGYKKWEHDKVHEIVKSTFLQELIGIKGKTYQMIGSTASLSTVQFEDLMSEIRQWASMEFSLFIPEPNEVPFSY